MAVASSHISPKGGLMDYLRLATTPPSPAPISAKALLLGLDLLNINGFRRKFAA